MRSDDPIRTLAASDPARGLPPLDPLRAAELAERALNAPVGLVDDLLGRTAPGTNHRARRRMTGRRVLAIAAILAVPIGASAAVPDSPLRDLLGSASETPGRVGPDLGRFGLARSVLPEELARDPHATGVLTAADFEDLGVRTAPTPLRPGSTLESCTVPKAPALVTCRIVRGAPIDEAHPQIIPAGTHWYRAKPRPGARAVLGTSDEDPGFTVYVPEQRILIELGPDGGSFMRTATPPESACAALPPDTAEQAPGVDLQALATLRAACAMYRARRGQSPSGP